MPETDSDTGAETARFQAFAARRDDDLPPAWQMRAPGSKIGILAAIVIGVAILAVILGLVLGA
jgi:multisubunit Na+/H+ antiporter MnhC subunit